MRNTLNRLKGFSLIELLVSLGISFLLILVIYKAYFLSTTYFSMGTDTIQEQSYLREIFSGMDNDFRYLNRFNEINEEMNTVEFEIFNTEIIEEDRNTNDKKVKGNQIIYSIRTERDRSKTEYLIITKTKDLYEWWMKFGHDQSINDELDPPGYTTDLLDPVTGKTVTERGEVLDFVQQDNQIPFIMTSIKYIPYDNDGKIIESVTGYDYTLLKSARSMKVEIEYLMKSEYGDSAGTASRKKTASTIIAFISFAENK